MTEYEAYRRRALEISRQAERCAMALGFLYGLACGVIGVLVLLLMKG